MLTVTPDRRSFALYLFFRSLLTLPGYLSLKDSSLAF